MDIFHNKLASLILSVTSTLALTNTQAYFISIHYGSVMFSLDTKTILILTLLIVTILKTL
jgi:hypothetical protein